MGGEPIEVVRARGGVRLEASTRTQTHAHNADTPPMLKQKRQTSNRQQQQQRSASKDDVAETPADAIVKANRRARVRAGRRAASVNRVDGGLYDWPASMIDANFVRDVCNGSQGEPFVVEMPQPIGLVAVMSIPTRWPFWADTNERRARWAAMVTAQRMAQDVLPQKTLDACRRCGASIIARRLDIYGPPERYASGDAQWQKVARLCDGLRRMMDMIDADRSGSGSDGLVVTMACDAQRMLAIMVEQTGGYCSPSCSARGTDCSSLRSW